MFLFYLLVVLNLFSYLASCEKKKIYHSQEPLRALSLALSRDDLLRINFCYGFGFVRSSYVHVSF